MQIWVSASYDHPVRHPAQLPLEQSEQPGGQNFICPFELMVTAGAAPGTALVLLLAMACCTET